MNPIRLQNTLRTLPALRCLRRNPDHSVPVALLTLYLGVWLIAPSHKPQIKLAPLPPPMIAVMPAPPVVGLEPEEQPDNYQLVRTLRLREGKDVWQLEKWQALPYSNRIDCLKIYCNGHLIREADASDVAGNGFLFGKMPFASRYPIFAIIGGGDMGNGAMKRFYTLRQGKIILMLEMPYCAGGPILRDCDGDGRPEWAFDDYDWYEYMNNGPERRAGMNPTRSQITQQPLSTLRWLRHNPQHSLPVAMFALYLGVWLIVPRHKAQSVPVPLPPPMIATTSVASNQQAKKQRFVPTESDIEWQSSVAVATQLGVRDKYGELGEYDARFFVIAPNGEKTERKIHVKNDHFGYVTFPDDFPTYFDEEGIYKWYCKVNGKRVVSGKFEYGRLKNGALFVTVLDSE
ncbi:uncharacterized protein KY384_000075 [Bacidia gigantensis]|uniref:uncharacterized protein n=1 Tax=Bacidia gigantensis TaxID=2732470 RepID=UPI001D03A962|nr:uncharacterized protein KY384_000075 [Bacidia gigantensis]KAG8526083.1 hypothetical protein KY384_000075 [Bacidia gigantensis]